MNKIEVSVLNEGHKCPAGMMMFLARLTQRGHTINDMEDLKTMYDASMGSHGVAKNVVALPHGTIKRFSPITIAVVGASRRFLAQARTHHVGIDFVSASLQYSDYSNNAQFVVPYELMFRDHAIGTDQYTKMYLEKCRHDAYFYRNLIEHGLDNDTAGYTMNQALRNILIIQGNHDAWHNFIRLRSCNRNTVETQYVAMLIWEALLETADGKEMFAWAGPDCLHGKCREGKMSCGKPWDYDDKAINYATGIINAKWPLLRSM